MRFIIHAGMHKTGSSSIQETFGHLNRANLEYTPFKSVNHCGLFAYLTHPSIETYHGFALKGFTLESLLSDRTYWTQTFQHFLRSLNETAIFSAEDISVATPAQLELLHKYLIDSSITPDVIVYLRPPISYMQSAFQERLKAGFVPKLSTNLWPGYRRRIEPLDTIFGKENVTVKPFHPWEFPSNNVVKDFARYVGVSLADDEIKFANESLSAEATSLLYLQRKLGSVWAEKTEKTLQQNSRWISVLSDIGSQKLCFGKGITEPILSKNMPDLLWAEKRIGCKLGDKDDNQGSVIEAEEDLFLLAEKQLLSLANTLMNKIDELEASPRAKLVRILETLRSLC